MSSSTTVQFLPFLVVLLYLLVSGRRCFAQRAQTALESASNSQPSDRRRSSRAPASIVFYRILGNDLPGRHAPGQTFLNLQRILKYEQPFRDCDKRFILNRIVNASLEAEIVTMLENAGVKFRAIKFEHEIYRQILLDVDCFHDPKYFLTRSHYSKAQMPQRWRAVLSLYRNKNLYVMNNNGARNLALKEGKKLWEWTLPWDGNCYMYLNGWQQLYQNMSQRRAKYFTVPMVRLADFAPNVEISHQNIRWDEPQIVFHWTSEQVFDEAYQYGNMPKEELLQRLGTPGPWSDWGGDASILKLKCFNQPSVSSRQPISRLDQSVGWVARLPSGVRTQDVGQKSRRNRLRGRQSGTLQFLMDLDMKLEGHTFKSMIFIDEETLANEWNVFQSKADNKLWRKVQEVLKAAGEALEQGPVSAMKKKSMPPLVNKGNYFHCALFNLQASDKKFNTILSGEEGPRQPTEEVSSENSGKLDRPSLQQVFDDTAITVLAWYFTRNATFAKHAVMLLEFFFIAKSTRINPQTMYGQYCGKNAELEILEMKDLYHYLDAVRLLEQSGVLKKRQVSGFQRWLKDYSKWLQYSRQGLREMLSKDHRGIYYDLQLASIAAYLGDRLLIAESLARTISRIPYHFTPDGIQVHELKRGRSMHYWTFNIMAWINFAMFSRKFGSPIQRHQSLHGASMVSAVELLIRQRDSWPYPDVGMFDPERFEVVSWIARGKSLINSGKVGNSKIYSLKSVFHPHDGVRPFWNLGLKPLEWNQP